MNKNMNANKKFENKKFVKTYFKKELNDAVDAMTGSEMVELVKELETTKYWVAVTKYTQDRMLTAQSSLCALDPIKYATEIARAQGILSGLMDLHSAVDNIKETTKQAEAKANAKNDDSTPPVDDEYSPGY